jgi:hypothetical protein
MTVDAGPSLYCYVTNVTHLTHTSPLFSSNTHTRVSQPNATTTMRGRRCLLVHVLCFPAGHCFQTHQTVKGSILSPRHLEGPTKESFSSTPRTDITTSASFLASPRTTVASASPDSGTTMVDQGVSLIGKTTSMLVAGTFFSVLAWKRDALMGESHCLRYAFLSRSTRLPSSTFSQFLSSSVRSAMVRHLAYKYHVQEQSRCQSFLLTPNSSVGSRHTIQSLEGVVE